MGNKQSQNILSIVAIAVAILGISIGYTTYSNSLEVANKVSKQQAQGANSINVDFSNSGLEYRPTDVTPVVSSYRMTANNAVINNRTNPTVSGMSAIFTTPGEYATYTFYAANRGNAVAFLNSLKYNNYKEYDTNVVCTAGNGTSPELVAQACENVVVSVKVGDDIETTSTIDSINGHTLSKLANEVVTVTITYLPTAQRVNGDFNVSVGDLELVYSGRN